MNNVVRNRTMVVEEAAKFLVLTASQFDEIVKAEMNRAKMRQLASAVKRLLKEFDLFKDLDTSVQENLADLVHYLRVPAGHVIFEQGDDPDLCYILLAGEVTVWNMKNFDGEGHHHRHEFHNLSLADGEEELREAEKLRSLGEQKDPRPPLASTNIMAQERCAALSNMLKASAKDESPNPKAHNMEDTIIQMTSTPVAALGPGSIFGELALINDNPRNASVSCYVDSEFLVMQKADFERLLKAEMKKAKDKKLAFLRGIVPGVRILAADTAERILYYFNKVTVPRNHYFIEQGEVLDGSIYFIWQGSVESYARDAPGGGFHRRAIMLQGSVFAAVPQGARAPFSVVSTSSPCEVLHVKPESRKHLPDGVIRSLREVLDNNVSRRSAQCLPLSPMGSVFKSPQLGIHSKQRENKQLQRPRSGKIPRPLSGKIPPLLQGQRHQNPMLGAKTKVSMMNSSLPSFSGLFQREVTEVDFEEFNLDPGETIAMLAKKPRRRERKNQKDSSNSASLPSLSTTANSFFSQN